MVVRREQIAEVVQQCADDHVVIGRIPCGARRGLQHML
jgi:hypothetical protein